MKYFTILALLLISCSKTPSLQDKLTGTWLLVHSKIQTGENIKVEDISKEKMIKIITPTHYAFLRHDLKNGTDSSYTSFVSGGGTNEFKDNLYIENLEYCNYREWENLSVTFEVEVFGDTLRLTGREKLDHIEIDQVITETFVRTSD